MSERTDQAVGAPVDARADWEERIYRRTDADETADRPELPAPAVLAATPGLGHVALTWSPVPDAAGYVVSRAETADGPWTGLDHGGSDVLAIPDPWYADAAVAPGSTYWYRVQATAGADQRPGPASAPVSARPAAELTAPVAVQVDTAAVTGPLHRVWEMVGSERLSQLWLERDSFGNPVGAEFAAALRRAHDELGVRRVRAHAIYHDDNAVFSWPEGGEPAYDFTAVDRIVDALIDAGVRPVLELGFMPRELATDASKTTFTYRGVISPPKDWSVWAELNRRLAAHLVIRYGIDEVAGWGFEVWNEPNLEVFWTGSEADYLRLYGEAARAVKSVDSRLLVGGPATAASEWVEDLCAYCARTGAPLDFVSTHTYGNSALDLHPTLRRYGYADARVWWTEWGVGHTHFAPIHDTAYGAPFVLRGFKSAQGRVDALAYWVVSDHFEELGRPPALLHGGFGLLTVGNLRKPRWWAVALAEGLGDEVLSTSVTGDGAGVLVEAWATRAADGRVDLLLWNAAPDASLAGGVDALGRSVRVAVSGLAAGSYAARLARVDAEHSSIARHVPDGTVWPSAELWDALRAADVLAEEDLDPVRPAGGVVELDVYLPMPGVARLRLFGEQSAR
jgi:xylan 1,4-beta-xylosidase